MTDISFLHSLYNNFTDGPFSPSVYCFKVYLLHALFPLCSYHVYTSNLLYGITYFIKIRF